MSNIWYQSFCMSLPCLFLQSAFLINKIYIYIYIYSEFWYFGVFGFLEVFNEKYG